MTVTVAPVAVTEETASEEVVAMEESLVVEAEACSIVLAVAKEGDLSVFR